MELAEAIEVVREFQAWRRGGDQPMPYPQTTGEALDAICDHAERMEADLATEREQLAANHEATKLLGKWLEAERALADRLLAIAEKAVSDYEGTLHCDDDCKCSGRRTANDNAEALAAWKEARK